MEDAVIRSLLFVPGDKEKLIHKALASASDAVIVDLEDAVGPEFKLAARDVTLEALTSAGRTKPVFVRLNAFDTGMTAGDLAAIMPARPFGVMLPKCSGPADLERLAHYLDMAEAINGIRPGATRIVTVATETATATLNLAIPAGHGGSRLWGLLWGAEDLAADLGLGSNRDEQGRYTDPCRHARTQCLYAANAAKAVAIDAVYVDFKDPEGLERECREGLRDGFTAKAAIHPSQVEIINRIMTPTADELEWARQVCGLLAETGVAQLNGKMIDIAHKRLAERILKRAGAAVGAA
ncbi:CoA ester lyase [Oricola sp.]|uniref:HpcH/HpaI aldolase/citrate lyase family protein n=1 Tax=Oricola sp. TaxID=1979950 RepID=UPI0025DBAC83|nr:CoA ester lyase [Oricola sp.]MCI5075383.1 CoA ester lyase [Oricola sp.]